MNLEGIILSDKSQTEKDNMYSITYVESKNKKINLIETERGMVPKHEGVREIGRYWAKNTNFRF